LAGALTIRHERNAAGGEFILQRGGERVGELVYSLSGRQMTIRHTGVDPAVRGRGVARKLVDAAVRFAREEHLKLASRCSYASAVFARSRQAFADVLAE
jgi:predicted GNAT family acetyltransferase